MTLPTTHAYTLTGLTNYAWCTVTLDTMVDSSSLMSDTVRVMPTDRLVYLAQPWLRFAASNCFSSLPGG